MKRLLRWSCRLCPATGASRDPVAAWRWHYANTHDAVTPTRVSTDVRDTIFRGTRWGR